MPVDYVKAWLIGVNTNNLIKNTKFKKTFERYKDEDLGETSRMVLKYKNLNIIIFTNNRVLLTGSLHYFYNDGKHNYNDFTFNNLQETLYRLSKLLNTELHKIILLNIEFGVNLNPLFKAKNITDNVLLHRTKEFLKPYDFNYKRATHQRFWIKVYDKGTQFKRQENILRIELKYKKMIDLNKIGLFTFEDLTNPNLYNNLLDILISKWNECILYDYTIKEYNLKPHLQKKILEYQNTNYWLRLSNQERTRQKKTLKELSINYGTNIQKQVSELILTKWNSLQ